MATEATFTIPAAEFPLGSIFDELPAVTVELERVIPAHERVIPYLWVRGRSTGDVKGAFDNHPAIEQMELVGSVADKHLFRADWNPTYDGVLNTLAETGVTLIKTIGTNEQWTFDVRGDCRRDLAAFQQGCQQHDIPIDVTKVSALTPVESITEAAVTDSQQEALVLAYNCGYFESPREVTLNELGEELGISQQAVASRLRRGINRILEGTLSETEP